MEIIIDNFITINNIPEWLKVQAINDLKFNNPLYEEALKNGYSTYGIPKLIYNFRVVNDNSIIVPRGYIQKLLEAKDKIDIDIIDKRKKFEPNYSLLNNNITLRPYQSEAIKRIALSTEGTIVAPAGSGKTVLGLSMISLWGQPTLWLTHTKPLLKQFVERVEYFIPHIREKDIGHIGDGKWKVGNLLTVATVQTLNKNEDGLAKLRDLFGLVILDECHHCPASTFRNTVSNLNPHYLFGLTATPYRRDKLEKMLFQTIGPIVVNISVDTVRTHEGIIMPTVKYVSVGVNSRRVDGNNTNKLISDHIINNESRNNLITSMVLADAYNGHTCLVMTDRTAHCDVLYDLIKKGYDRVAKVDGGDNKEHIKSVIDKYRSGEINVLIATTQLLGEGFDVNHIDRVYIVCPFRAEAKVEQVVGRVQRPAPGKTDAIIYDYVDTNIGVFMNQFYAKRNKSCRYNVYQRLGLTIEPY